MEIKIKDGNQKGDTLKIVSVEPIIMDTGERKDKLSFAVDFIMNGKKYSQLHDSFEKFNFEAK